MMPLAPTSIMAMPTSKPKIGFSIDSIVGSALTIGKSNPISSGSECSERQTSPFSDCSYPPATTELNVRIRNRMPLSPHKDLYRCTRLPSPKDHRIRRYSISSGGASDLTRSHCRSNESPDQMARPPEVERLSPDERLAPPKKRHLPHSQSPSPEPLNGCAASVLRPFPVTPNVNDLKTLPSYMTTGPVPPDMAPHHNSHFLAAQFQMAAALAHGQAAVAAAGGQGLPPGAVFPAHHPHYANPGMQRDSYPLYPWLLSRHGRIFPNRFPGNFLLQPFRKPKRIRTAFSPSQLLKLEHAFESNHYVVGAERKALAQALSLSETQVKVWFQNRRTKHKRMQQEEDTKGGTSGGSSSGNTMPLSPEHNGSQISYDEDELIDMDDCSDDDRDV